MNICLLLTGWLQEEPWCPDCRDEARQIRRGRTSHVVRMRPRAFSDGWKCPCCGLFLPESEFSLGRCKDRGRS